MLTSIRFCAAITGGALLAIALSTAACGSGTDSPAGPSPTVQPPATTERDALVAQYHAAGGPDWTDTTNWLSSEPLGTWYGVEAEDDRVTKLDLCGPDGNNLRGTIAPELGSLTAATDLRLSNNFLTGTIPSTLGNMTALEILRLSNNALSGTVPAELGDLTNLVELRLHRNQLTGELPRTLMDLTNLRRLRIEDNAGLCAPADADVQEWLGSLDEFESDCAAAATSARADSHRRPAGGAAGPEHRPFGLAAVHGASYAPGRWLVARTANPIARLGAGATRPPESSRRDADPGGPPPGLAHPAASRRCGMMG
ncbi:MAG: hypothetical protein F4018_11885 [Acidobacteria bacterium]|nr:hypothetical protein [Acidobacteriota bacterium]MYK88970.1 hypothetical protein [Acidobacteriota bacterium]